MLSNPDGCVCPVVHGCPRYDICTFSRPDHPLALLGYPVVRWLQWRFRQDSLRAVARAAAAASLDDSWKKNAKNKGICKDAGEGW